VPALYQEFDGDEPDGGMMASLAPSCRLPQICDARAASEMTAIASMQRPTDCTRSGAARHLDRTRQPVETCRRALLTTDPSPMGGPRFAGPDAAIAAAEARGRAFTCARRSVFTSSDCVNAMHPGGDVGGTTASPAELPGLRSAPASQPRSLQELYLDRLTAMATVVIASLDVRNDHFTTTPRRFLHRPTGSESSYEVIVTGP
jgi:hypothetical protein